MKTFATNGTGSQQTLTELDSEKIPVYDTLEDAESDLANLAENQIIATHDTGSELSAPVDTVQSGNMHAATSNAVARENAPVFIEGGTDAGGNFIDGNGNQILVSQYSIGQYISKSGDSGYILTPYKEVNDPPETAKWALYNTVNNAWVMNRTNLFAMFRK